MNKLKEKALSIFPVNDLSIGALKSILVRVASLLSGFVLQIVLARSLSEEAFGDYTYVITLLGFLTLFGKLGFDTASKRFLPKYRVEKKTEVLNQFLMFALIIPLAASLVIISVGEISLKFFDFGYSYQLQQTIRTGWWLLPALVLLNILVAQLEAAKKILSAQIPFHLARPLLMVIVLLVLGFGLGIAFSAPFAIGLNAGISLLLVVVLLVFLKKYYKHAWRWTSGIIKAHSRTWLSVALPLLLTAGLHLVLNQADILLIGHFLESEDVGQYAVALKLASLVLFGLTAVNVIAAPLISEYFVAKKQAALQKMIAMNIALVFGMAVILGAGLLVFDNWILGIYGESFKIASGALAILVVANVLNTSTGPVSFVLTMTEYHMQSLCILIISAVANVGLNIMLIPKMGIEGAAYATLVSTIIWNVLMYIVARLKLKIDTSLLSLRYLFK